jgi:hypothetical protein
MMWGMIRAIVNLEKEYPPASPEPGRVIGLYICHVDSPRKKSLFGVVK